MLKVYVGWDGRDAAAFEVCRHSLIERASIEVEVIALKEWELRRAGIYWREYHVDRDGQRWDGRDGKPFGTDFSFTRFAALILENNSDDWTLFCDPDFLWRADIANMIDLVDPSKAMMCVKHNHIPTEAQKGVGVQTIYNRKNWSSLMLFRPSRNKSLTKYALNNQTGSWLHGMLWLSDEEIGDLPEEWNWLEGWSDPNINPKVVHFTRGTPDMPGYEDTAYADEWRATLAAVAPAVASTTIAFNQNWMKK